MAGGIGAFELDDYRALLQMAEGGVPFAATIAKATLAIVEARRDAEVRAARAEVALEAELARVDALRSLISAHSWEPVDADATLREAAKVLGL